MKNKYQHATNKENYEDYSSGRVLYGATGATNFPVRLSSEIFQQCANYLKSRGKSGPYKIYDPFCGVAYSLTVIGLLHSTEIKSIIASDSDSRILEFAEKNLSLLSTNGLNKRIKELTKFVLEYNKTSHKYALASALRLQSKVELSNQITVKCFKFNSISNKDFPQSLSGIDMIITDLPYGKLTHWEGSITDKNFTQRFLDNIKSKLNTTSVIAIVSNKKQPILYQGYKIIKTFTIIKRRITILEPLNN